MSILAPKLSSTLEKSEALNSGKEEHDVGYFSQRKQFFFLQAVIEGFVDGVLILTEQGGCVHANACARRICRQLAQCTSELDSVPPPIWRICETLLDSRKVFSRLGIILESEIDLGTSGGIRIRVRWLELGETAQPYLLVTLEDRYQSTQKAAIADAQKYGLTRRESEVWALKCANHSYKEIANRLYITLNTVKKHMKSIYAKQQASLWAQAG